MRTSIFIPLLLCSAITIFFFNTNVSAEPKENSIKYRIAELLKRINEQPDILHGDYTPSVHDLIKIGLPALQHGTLDLLLSGDRNTRMRAQKVLEGITMAQMGFQSGKNKWWKEDEWKRLWKTNNSYHYDAPAEARHVSHRKWSHWIETAGRAK